MTYIDSRYKDNKNQVDAILDKMNSEMCNSVHFTINNAVDFWEWYSDEYYCAGWLDEDTEILEKVDANLIVKWLKNRPNPSNNISRITNELYDVVNDAIAEYKDVFSDCTDKDIVEALKKVMEDYQ